MDSSPIQHKLLHRINFTFKWTYDNKLLYYRTRSSEAYNAFLFSWCLALRPTMKIIYYFWSFASESIVLIGKADW